MNSSQSMLVPCGSIDNYVTGVSECSQQRGNLKDDGYRHILYF
ncbi:hypothetical protein [Photorhabdus bodei]|nr:hypothetical protein [Photorhabdus bodei]